MEKSNFILRENNIFLFSLKDIKFTILFLKNEPYLWPVIRLYNLLLV